MSDYVYPRLDGDTALEVLEQIRHTGTAPYSLSHVKAVPVEIGNVVSDSRLRKVRRHVLEATDEWGGKHVPRTHVAAWDQAVGRALHTSMAIVPSDASHPGVWSFITLVLLPDVAVTRFPDLHDDRFLGGLRNTFYRCWRRQHVLGDLETGHATPLGEDELVGIFERSKMARDHRVAKALASEILSCEASNRSQFARDLSMAVRAHTGPLLLDVLNLEQIQTIVSSEATRIIGAGKKSKPRRKSSRP